MTKIYGIRNKITNEFISYNSKCAWTKVGNAKNAWANANWDYRTGKSVKFDDQVNYEIVDLTEAYYRLEGLKK